MYANGVVLATTAKSLKNKGECMWVHVGVLVQVYGCAFILMPSIPAECPDPRAPLCSYPHPYILMRARHAGISAFVVDMKSPGITLGNKDEKLGSRASSTSMCHVPCARYA